MILMQALTSCTSCPKKEETDLIWYPVPNPIVNDVSVVKMDFTTETVFVPFWYWSKIETYIFITEANIKKLHPD